MGVRIVDKDNSKNATGLGWRRGLLEQVLVWRLTIHVAPGCARPYNRYSGVRGSLDAVPRVLGSPGML